MARTMTHGGLHQTERCNGFQAGFRRIARQFIVSQYSLDDSIAPDPSDVVVRVVRVASREVAACLIYTLVRR